MSAGFADPLLFRPTGLITLGQESLLEGQADHFRANRESEAIRVVLGIQANA